MTDIIDADDRELQRLGHAPEVDHIPVPQAHRPPAYAFQQAEHDVTVLERDNPGEAWVLCEDGAMQVEQ